MLLFITNGCYAKSPSISILPATTPESSLTPSSTTSSDIQIVPALTKISVEFYRNGKTYEIFLGYELGQAFFRSTPFPEIPENKKENRISSADVVWYGDLDNDGEIEVIVSILDLGSYLSEMVRVYRYDPMLDDYYVADEMGGDAPVIESYEDLDQDGKLELISGNFGFCFQCSHATRVFTTITVLQFQQGKFMDVTKEFPELVEEDAANFLDMVKNPDYHPGEFMIIASYLYDMYRIGKMEQALTVYDQICVPEMLPSDLTCDEFKTEIIKIIEERESTISVP